MPSSNGRPLNSSAPHTILVVDDEYVIRDIFAKWLRREGYRVLLASTAEETWGCLRINEIDLLTLDINLPDSSGLEILAQVKVERPELPVVMLTASSHLKTAVTAMTAGACGYLTKPIHQHELLVQVARGLELRRLLLERRDYTSSLEAKVLEQTRNICEAHEETVRRLVTATTCRDQETGAHIVRTGLLSEVLARAAGWSAAEAEAIRFAAPMHDVGKIGIADAILRKPGRLTDQEYSVMKTHTSIGAAILAGSKTTVLQLAQQIALHHHERWDGAGYPTGLAGYAIPEAARIVSIIDVFDALTHDRIYRPAFSAETAIAMMKAEQGAQFDPILLTTFLTILDDLLALAAAHPDDAVDVCSASSAASFANVTVPI